MPVTKPQSPRAATRQRGFSLVEALVSLVVISVGMIGIAALYGEGLNAGSTALYRVVAVNLAADMADRIRANPMGGVAYEGAGENKKCDPQTGGPLTCTPADMAAHDTFVWKGQLDKQLPSPAGAVDYDGTTNPPTFKIDVTWQEVGLRSVTYSITIQVPPF